MIKRENLKRFLAVAFWLAASVLLLLRVGHAGTAYYFDPTASSSTNVGTYANPFRTLVAVNAKAFASGDDLYFKVGTTFTSTDANDYLIVDWDGTSSDSVIIGAYYGEGQFGLNGGARPKLDGDFKFEPPMIFVNLTADIYDGYVTVKDLELFDCGVEYKSLVMSMVLQKRTT